MDKAALIPIQVCYATPAETLLLDITVPQGACIADAIRISNIQAYLPPDFKLENQTGIFGKLYPLSALLNPHDRIDICLPLLADPKEARKKRAERKG